MTQTTPAAIILNQLGGSKFIAMVGAHGILNLGNGLQLKFRGSKRANVVRIELNANDLYTLRFFKQKGLDCPELEGYTMVHAESLTTIFTRVTGLHVSL